MNVLRNLPTLILYLTLAFIIAFLFKKAISAKCNCEYFNFGKKSIEKKYIYYFFVYLIFILFSCFRVVSDDIGGADVRTYMKYFNTISYVPFFSIDNLLLNSYEYVFYNLMVLVRTLWGNYFIFEFIVFSTIIICYIYSIDKSINDKNKWCWIALAFLPLLKSLNIIRNCVATAIGFAAIEFLRDDRDEVFFALAILSFLNHYIAIVLFLFYLFYRFFPDKIIFNRKKLLILNISIMAVSVAFLPFAKLLLSISGFSGYLNKIEISLFGYFPFVFFYFLMLYDLNIVRYLKENNHLIYYKIMVFLSLILPIFILLNGASRVLLFFELPRYLLYSDIYVFYKSKVPEKYVKFYKFGVVILIILWLAFKIIRIWEGYGLVPYYSKLF